MERTVEQIRWNAFKSCLLFQKDFPAGNESDRVMWILSYIAVYDPRDSRYGLWANED